MHLPQVRYRKPDICYIGLQTGDFRNWEKSRSFSLLFLLIVTNSKEELEMLVYMIGCYKTFFRVEVFVSFLSNRGKENTHMGACTHMHNTLLRTEPTVNMHKSF